ncbi:hypothetical protein [Nocardioides pacificus]
MLRGILGRVLGGGGRRGGAAMGTPGMAGGRSRGTAGGNAEMARGAKSLLRGLSKKRGR